MENTKIINKKPEHWITNPMSPRLLPLKKAAEVLGLSVYGLRERIWAGQIPVVRFSDGGKMYVDSRDLEKFVERHKERIV
jgi:predicted site-specific integrase-resolvase